ncbi:MAG: hypothetical protein VX768_04550 [Planctomycetota bacterium]|nr:hypothetical protein [Planctomycetota bacterium]
MTVEVGTAEFTLRPLFTHQGSARVMPPRQISIVSPSRSVIVSCRKQGERVQQGELLVQLDTQSLIAEKQRLQQQLPGNPENRQLAEQIRKIDGQIAASLIRAPCNLMIARSQAQVGKQVDFNSPLMETMETGIVRLEARLPAWLTKQAQARPNLDLWLDDRPFACRIEIQPNQLPELSSTACLIRFESENSPWTIAQKIKLRAESEVEIGGYWFQAGGLKMDALGKNHVFRLEEARGPDHRSVWIIRNFPIKLVDQKGQRIFAECPDVGSLEYVASGVHRVVDGQQVLPAETSETPGSSG